MEKQKILPAGITAALIDMDGVLYDSMPHHARAWHRMLTERGIATDPDEFYLYEGMTGGATIDLIFQRELKRPATEKEQKELYARKAELFVASGKKEKMAGASEMLKAFIDNGVKRVLVTGSAQSSLLDSLDEDYPGAFTAGMRVTANDVKQGKPDPEPYLRGLEKAGVTARHAMVVENAPLGVRAGKAAGCFTVAVTTGPIPREEFEKEGADLIFSSMKEFADWLKETLPDDPGRRLDKSVEECRPDSVTIVTDSNVARNVFPGLAASSILINAPKVVLQPGESNKSLASVEKIWGSLEDTGSTRNSLIINIGGGMVTDTGGFAAATFKRGIRYINLPTTLLGAVDAATGGKTGVNFRGLKNEIGAFHLPVEVIVTAFPFATLPEEELMSGYAEMVKTGLIADKGLYNLLLDPSRLLKDPIQLEDLLRRCVDIKEEVVRMDPREKGLRKILNFGHTAGHAFESLMASRATFIPHGVAVAHGMLVELILSHNLQGFPAGEINRYTSAFLKPFFRRLAVSCTDIDKLMDFMANDKKNSQRGAINFTLLLSPGNPITDCTPGKEEILTAFDIYRDMME